MYLLIHPSIYLLWLQFSTRDNFALREHMTISGGNFSCQNWGRGCSWHLVSADQGHSSTPHTVPRTPHIRDSSSLRRQTC